MTSKLRSEGKVGRDVPRGEGRLAVENSWGKREGLTRNEIGAGWGGYDWAEPYMPYMVRRVIMEKPLKGFKERLSLTRFPP